MKTALNLLIIAAVALLAMFCGRANAADCRPFFRSFSHSSYGHKFNYGNNYGADLIRTFYWSAGPFIESKASLAYEKATDEEYRSFKEFQKFKQDYATFEEFKAAQEKKTEVRAPLVANRCGSCHAGANAPKGIVLDGSTAITADQITASIKAVRAGTMPKGEPLDDSEKPDFLAEILDLETPTK